MKLELFAASAAAVLLTIGCTATTTRPDTASAGASMGSPSTGATIPGAAGGTPGTPGAALEPGAPRGATPSGGLETGVGGNF